MRILFLVMFGLLSLAGLFVILAPLVRLSLGVESPTGFDWRYVLNVVLTFWFIGHFIYWWRKS